MLGGDPGRVEEFWKEVQERNDPRFHQVMLIDMDRGFMGPYKALQSFTLPYTALEGFIKPYKALTRAL